jgi:hypothetical protein
MTDPNDMRSVWSPSAEHLVFLNRDLDALQSPFANQRVSGIEAVTAQGRFDAVPRLKELLDDDAPVIWDDVVGEVRQAALAGLQRLYWAGGRAIDFGPVLVRPAWPLREMRAAYNAALADLSPVLREAVVARARDVLTERVRPLGIHEDDALAYRVLQELGQVDYEKQEVDPKTKLTPLQEELYARQVEQPPARPALRVALRESPTTAIGWIHRNPATGACTATFSEHPAAGDARQILSNTRSLGKTGVPRLVFGADGRPKTTPDGNYVLDGEIPLDSDDVEGYLRTIQVFMDNEFATELVV